MIVALSSAASMAQPQDWQAELQMPPDGEFRRPGDPIALYIPPDVPIEALQHLALELNNLDVTELLRREGDFAILKLPQTLDAGSHHLRVVEYTADGGILERGAWTFEVRRTGALRNLAMNADPSLEVSHRLDEGGLTSGANRTTVRGASNVEGLAADGPWQANAAANFFYNSERDQTLDGRKFDLGEYRVGATLANDSLNAELMLGHHDVGVDSLIMSGFNRRGLSAKLGTANARAEVRAFAMGSQSRIGFPHLTGAGISEDQVNGFAASVRPIEALTENIRVSGVYYDGEGSTGGVGVGGSEFTNSGSGWAAAVDSLWFDERLSMRGEFARTVFDFDGEGTGNSGETDNAFSLQAAYSPYIGEEFGEGFLDWTVGIRYDRIDTFFQSLANPALEVDRDSISLFTDVSWGGATVEAQATRWENNVNNLGFLPTQRTYEFSLNGTYVPAIDLSEEGDLPWYGQPNYTFGIDIVDSGQTETPAAFVGTEIDTLTTAVNLSAGSVYDTWDWNLGETVSSFEDRSDVTSDTLNFLTDLSTQLTVNDRFSGRANIQWSLFKDQGLGNHSNTINIGLGANVVVIPQVLNFNMDYTFLLQIGPDDTPDTHIVNGELLWILREAAANQVGVAWSFTGSVQEQDDDVDDGLPDTTYQIFGRFKLFMPVSY